MSTYPDYQSLLECPDSNDVMRIKRSIASILSLCAKVFISVVIVITIDLIFGGEIKLSLVWSSLPDISLRWLAILPALLFLNVVREYHDDIYIFGMHGITQHQGRLSLNKRVPYVKYSDILSLKLRQDPWGRIFNYGNIELDTAAEAGVELTIEGISSPDELFRLVEQLRLHSTKAGMVDRSAN